MTTPNSPGVAHSSRRPQRGNQSSGPPGRADSRRPGQPRSATPPPQHGQPSKAALRIAAQRAKERRPPFWFAHQLLLVLSGQRPLHTLMRHVREDAYDQLALLAPHAPLRPRGADRTAPVVLDAHGTQPSEEVIEAFARIATGGEQRAMAFRLERDTGKRWRCTAVELDTGSR